MFGDRFYRCYMDAVQHCSHVAAGDRVQGKKVAAIVVFTATGKTAQLLANQRRDHSGKGAFGKKYQMSRDINTA